MNRRDEPFQIAILLYPCATALDAVAPWEVLSRKPPSSSGASPDRAALLVLRRTGRVQDGRVHAGAGRDSYHFGLQVKIHGDNIEGADSLVELTDDRSNAEVYGFEVR
jgi:putative intracellular protease/amidase